jgi:hypothetical protein
MIKVVVVVPPAVVVALASFAGEQDNDTERMSVNIGIAFDLFLKCLPFIYY